MPPRRALLLSLLLPCAALARPASAGPPLLFVDAYFHVEASLDGLRGAAACAVSPDGAQVYVAGKGDDALSEWSRDPSNGALTPLGQRELGDSQVGGDVPNFDRPEALAISPDGANLYVGVGNSHALAIFARNAATGLLDHAGSVLDGTDGASLGEPLSLAVSPDGAFVYVGDYVGAVDVFSRDQTTGLLVLVQALLHEAPTVDGLDHVRWLALSPDGRNLYVSSDGDNAVGVYQRDGATGKLAFLESQQHGVGGIAGLVDPFALQVSPEGTYLYVASHGSPPTPGSVDVFSRDADTGALSALDSIAEGDIGFEAADDLALSPDATRVYVSAQGQLGTYDSKLAVFSRDPATGALTLLDLIADDANGVDGLKGALAVAASSDGKNVYVASEQDAPASSMQTERGALAAFRTAPEPAPAAAAGAALAALAQLSASQSRGRKNTS
jgi:6-phosphogluconolactonase (cycloisomerase 2 family)